MGRRKSLAKLREALGRSLLLLVPLQAVMMHVAANVLFQVANPGAISSAALSLDTSERRGGGKGVGNLSHKFQPAATFCLFADAAVVSYKRSAPSQHLGLRWKSPAQT
jgi:hypothetical protein